MWSDCSSIPVNVPSPGPFSWLQITFFPVLQTFPGLSTQPQTKDWSGVGVESELTSGATLRTVSHVMEQIQEEMQKLPESCECFLFSEAGLFFSSKA